MEHRGLLTFETLEEGSTICCEGSTQESSLSKSGERQVGQTQDRPNDDGKNPGRKEMSISIVDSQLGAAENRDLAFSALCMYEGGQKTKPKSPPRKWKRNGRRRRTNPDGRRHRLHQRANSVAGEGPVKNGGEAGLRNSGKRGRVWGAVKGGDNFWKRNKLDGLGRKRRVTCPSPSME